MYEYKVKEVVKVVDGDTVDLVLDLGFGLYKKRVRVAGITLLSLTHGINKRNNTDCRKAWMKGMLSDCEGLTVRTARMVSTEEGWLYKDDLINTRMIEQDMPEYDGANIRELTDLFVR